MKKLLIAGFFLMQVLAVYAGPNDPFKVKTDNTKIYQQPASASEVVTTVNPADEIKLVRRFDRRWSLVEVNGQAGYIQTYKLGPVRKQKH